MLKRGCGFRDPDCVLILFSAVLAVRWLPVACKTSAEYSIFWRITLNILMHQFRIGSMTLHTFFEKCWLSKYNITLIICEGLKDKPLLPNVSFQCRKQVKKLHYLNKGKFWPVKLFQLSYWR